MTAYISGIPTARLKQDSAPRTIQALKVVICFMGMRMGDSKSEVRAAYALDYVSEPGSARREFLTTNAQLTQETLRSCPERGGTQGRKELSLWVQGIGGENEVLVVACGISYLSFFIPHLTSDIEYPQYKLKLS